MFGDAHYFAQVERTHFNAGFADLVCYFGHGELIFLEQQNLERRIGAL
jgi:hypothetical protein